MKLLNDGLGMRKHKVSKSSPEQAPVRRGRSMSETLVEFEVAKASVEWPTIALAALIYGGWLALTYWHQGVSPWLLMPAGAWLVCWHSSLQHEVLHGHPTCNARLNRAIALPPLALWLPFDRYRALHLKHHHDERLTDPLDDPESRYLNPESWASLGPLGQRIVRAQGTLAGRLIIGPFWAVGHFLAEELRALIAAEPGRRLIWAQQAAGVAVIVIWLHFVCGMSVWFYVAGFAIPGTSLMLIRSFAEHRADADVARRTAVVDGHGPLAWLFLFNNLHAAHHARPHIPWYRLPAFYRANRAVLTGPHRGPFYRGYGDVFRRFLLKPHDKPIHPLGRISAEAVERSDTTAPV
jgi:fatty acid desaturase